jgi:anti-sigma regulatory factor (Ser/Thr protein kinase)
MRETSFYMCAIAGRASVWYNASQIRAGPVVPLQTDLGRLEKMGQEQIIEFCYPAKLRSLTPIIDLVHQAALAYGAEYADQMKLAASEVVSNVIRHACGFEGQMHGRIALRAHEMQVDLFDDGVAFDPDAVPRPDLGVLREGGYGLHIARQLLDELSYTPAGATQSALAPGGSRCANHWRLLKRADRGPETGPDRTPRQAGPSQGGGQDREGAMHGATD